jgi:hypothetical protein
MCIAQKELCKLATGILVEILPLKAAQLLKVVACG